MAEEGKNEGGSAAETQTGRVISLASRGCYVETTGAETLRCELRGQAKAGIRARTHPVAVGDEVRFTRSSPGEGVVEEVLQRRSVFSRLASARRLEQVLAANADAVLAITSTETPPFRPGLVDRVLVAAEAGGLEGWVCLNKVDLEAPQDTAGVLEAYTRIGYRVFRTSARTGEGMESLAEAFHGKLVILVGHSGVGKSSLLRRIEPSLELKINPISAKSGRGVHTTTAPRMLRIGGGRVIDTPGVRTFHPFGVTAATLWRFYPDLAELASDCRFRDCRHASEEGCAIREAVEERRVDRGRYERYLRIMDTLP